MKHFVMQCLRYSLYLLLYLLIATAILMAVIVTKPEWLYTSLLIAGALPTLFVFYRFRRRLFPELYALKKMWDSLWDLIFVRAR